MGHWSNDFQGSRVMGQESVVKGQMSRLMIRGHWSDVAVKGHWSNDFKGSRVKSQLSRVIGQGS